MPTESWREKFFKLADEYLEASARLQYATGELKWSRVELHKRWVRLTDTQQEALRGPARNLVGRLIENKQEIITVENKLLKGHKLMEMRKQRKDKIAKRVLEVE